jgi:metal-responsive CopG/Arc/MetJ family transcriptional regulator
MGKKRRFGIAIDSAIAEKLDNIAKSMNMDRSKLVEKAVTDLIEEHSHSLGDHRCCGVMVVEACECSVVERFIENYRDIIVSYSHNHVEKWCVCTMVILGDSRKVRALHRELMVTGSRVKYIPIAH